MDKGLTEGATPGKISSGAKADRYPPEVDGIQVNFCKNPTCPNFGVPPLDGVKRGKPTVDAVVDGYIVTSGKGTLVLHCKACGEYPPLKSNQAIAEERARLLAVLKPRPEPSCPNSGCQNVDIPVSRGKEAYQSFGATRSDSRRFRCKACGKTFAVGTSTTGHKQPHKNKTVFALLMNKSPMRRVCEVAEIDPKTLYGKINFIHAQCLAFAADRERKLLEGMSVPRLYLSVDRQDYVVNWSRREDRRNVTLTAIGCADNETGYVFGMHLNYDPRLDAEEVEGVAAQAGDYQVKPPFREHARVWLKGDYSAAMQLRARGLRSGQGDLRQAIEETYVEATGRPDVEVSESLDGNRRLPTKGMQVHSDYSMYGHFFFLRELFRGVGKLRFFLDQESGIRAACLAAFQPEVSARRADAFYVRINKEMTITEKRAALGKSRRAFDAARQENPGLSDDELKLLLIRRSLQGMMPIGQWKDRWLIHPFPNMSEPEKAICHLTGYGDYDEEHLARLYGKASLHGIDCFFMQVRRRLSILERPIATASRVGRIWHGYSAYNPETIVKLLDVFRVFYNFCLEGKDGRTPAGRLGLAKGKIDLENVIYY